MISNKQFILKLRRLEVGGGGVKNKTPTKQKANLSFPVSQGVQMASKIRRRPGQPVGDRDLSLGAATDTAHILSHKLLANPQYYPDAKTPHSLLPLPFSSLSHLNTSPSLFQALVRQ